MAEYYSKEALMEAQRTTWCDMYDLEDFLTEVPKADVVEVKNGTWYHGTENGVVYAKCSACGRKMNYSCYGYAYCSLCGARMDGTPQKEG